MERLSGLDASFLYLETPALHMHVSMAAVFDPATVPGGYSFDKVRALVSERLALAPVFRRRLVEVPFRLGHPYWVDDPDFDVDYHLRRAALPSPGGLAELARFTGEVCGRPLDRTKPLWEMYVVEGLDQGRVAIVTKIHHCTIDGVSGAELLAQLFDVAPNPPPREPPIAPRPEGRLPSEVELALRALVDRINRPREVLALAWRTGRAVLDVSRLRRRPGDVRGALPLTAPRTSLNGAITPHRRVVFGFTSLEEVKRIKRVLGVTVNDVVLTVCAGALRRWLDSRGELPDQPLVATVPVSVRPAAHSRPGSNKVSAMFVALPTHLADPLERVRAIASSTRGAKEELHALGVESLMDWAEHASPNLFSLAARTYTRLKLAKRHRPIHNLVISNVPGPDFPLYFGGAELKAAYPLGPIMEGAALNITVMSYRGALNWGLIACPETVSELDRMIDDLHAASEELADATGIRNMTGEARSAKRERIGGVRSAT
jgi:diacylglycerol O-acyltransferase